MTVLSQHRGRGERPSDEGHKGIGALVREIVRQAEDSEGPAGEPWRGGDHEEILVDTHIDGARYLLVRLPEARPLLISLSPREQEIVGMVAKGYPNKTIAGVLNISAWTVCTHLRRTFAKLGVTSRAAMVARLMEERRSWDRPQSEARPQQAAKLPIRNSLRMVDRKVSKVTMETCA
jgi:two-component system, NarL family, nitrate/nitrite response regulator NarL